MYALMDDFEIEMTKNQALSASHPGDCEDEVQELLLDRKIVRQLDKIGPDKIRAYLLSTGGWEEDELTDDARNRVRIVWLAACDIVDEIHERNRGR